MKRRTFIKSCCGGLFAITNASIGNLVFAQSGSRPRDVIISVFLRGGMDSLNFLVPYHDPDYHTARADLALGGQHVLDLDGQFGLHPAAAPLKELFDQGHLAPIVACGSTDASRSHFDAQDYMERGKPGDTFFSGGGWLARHLSLNPSDDIFRAVSQGSAPATSLEGVADALSMDGAEGFTLQGDWQHVDDMRRALREMYGADPDLSQVAMRTLDATDIIDYADPDNYEPPGDVEYPNTSIGRALASMAQLIRLDLGLQAGTIDMGGWDTHRDQASSDRVTGGFADNVRQLSEALHSFWSDMTDKHGKITVVVMTEFGRRLKENDNRGTDHGHGGMMMVLSNAVTQKRVWGQWPGLGYEQLFQNVDLEVTTDFRTVLSDILLARGGTTDISHVFPDYSYRGPVGFFNIQTSVNAATAAGFAKL